MAAVRAPRRVPRAAGPRPPRRAASGLGATALLLAALSCGAEEPAAPRVASARSGDLRVEEAWALPSLPPHTTCAAFLTLHNDGAEPDALVAVEVDAAEDAQMHTMQVDAQQVMRMREVPRYAVPPGGSHVLAPGGDHLMFYGLARPWLDGEEVELTLRFERAPELRLRIPVRPRP